jgi:cytoskeleton protein RodZ
LRLQAREPSWIQVVGASGRVWLQRTVQPGEVVRLDEDLPLAVIVGRADATDVVVRGERFDLGSLARNNVARFQVR